MASEVLDRFLSLESTDERVHFLSHRTTQSRIALFEEWSKDERLRVTEMVALPPEHQIWIVAFVCGHQKRGIIGSKPNFFVKPNKDWEPDEREKEDLGEETIKKWRECVMLENGSYQNQRRWVPIKGPTILPAEKGIQAMLAYGPDSQNKLMQGRLTEISAAEYYAATGNKVAEKAKAEADTRVAEAEAKAAEARAEAERLRAELEDMKASKKSKKGK